MLGVFDPSGAAGSDHRKYTVILHPVDQLMRFFHDRQIGAELCIKNLIKAQLPQCICDPFLYINTDWKFKILT